MKWVVSRNLNLLCLISSSITPPGPMKLSQFLIGIILNFHCLPWPLNARSCVFGSLVQHGRPCCRSRCAMCGLCAVSCTACPPIACRSQGCASCIDLNSLLPFMQALSSRLKTLPPPTQTAHQLSWHRHPCTQLCLLVTRHRAQPHPAARPRPRPPTCLQSPPLADHSWRGLCTHG